MLENIKWLLWNSHKHSGNSVIPLFWPLHLLSRMCFRKIHWGTGLLGWRGGLQHTGVPQFKAFISIQIFCISSSFWMHSEMLLSASLTIHMSTKIVLAHFHTEKIMKPDLLKKKKKKIRWIKLKIKTLMFEETIQHSNLQLQVANSLTQITHFLVQMACSCANFKHYTSHLLVVC